MGLFGKKKKDEDGAAETVAVHVPGPREAMIRKALKVRFLPPSDGIHVRDVGRDEKDQDFRVLVVSRAFENVTPFGKRQRLVMDAIGEETKGRINASALWVAALTVKEWEGDATVPAQCCDFADRLGLGREPW